VTRVCGVSPDFWVQVFASFTVSSFSEHSLHLFNPRSLLTKPYETEKTHPVLHGRVPHARRSAFQREPCRLCERVQGGPRSGANDPRDHLKAQNAAYRAIAPKLGCQQADRDTGERSGLTSEEKARLKALERENRELRQENEILKKASAYFAPPLDDASIACRATGRSSTGHSNDDWVHSLSGRA